MSAALREYYERLRRWSFARDVLRRADFYEIMADAAHEGLPQVEVLNQVRKHLKPHDGLALVIDMVMRRLRGAATSSTTGQKTIGTELRGLLPDAEVNMIAAGELSGAIEQGWRNAAQFARRQHQLRSAVWGALAKPLFYAAAFMALLLFLSFYLMPKFEQTRPRSQWPGIAQSLGWAADNAILIVLSVVAFIIVLAVVISVVGRRWTGPARDAADRRWPPFTLMSNLSGASFMLALASFLSSGISFGEALQRMRQTATPYIAWQIQRIEGAMRRGARPEQALLTTSLLAQQYHWVVAVYGLVGAQDAARAYERIALEMARRTQTSMQRALGSVLGNLMLFGLAGGVVWVYFSLMGIATAGMKI